MSIKDSIKAIVDTADFFKNKGVYDRQEQLGCASISNPDGLSVKEVESVIDFLQQQLRHNQPIYSIKVGTEVPEVIPK